MSRRNRAKKKSKTPAIILILFIIAAIAAAGFYLYGGKRCTELSEEVTINIPEGSSANIVTSILKENDLILNEISFSLFIRQCHAESDLKPGDYTFGPGKVTYANILSELKLGDVVANTVTITIPEGLTVYQTAQLLEEKNIINAQEFMDYAGSIQVPFDYIPQGTDYTQFEGFLYPETYNIGTEWDAAQILDLMLNEFNNNWTTERQARAAELGLTAKQILTVASLIEREVKVEDERPLVASVIYNRLNADMMLQIDATVQYILGKQKERLLYSDLEIDSPYNTYKYKGLPPGPIAAPGISCIDAALYPADTTYLFYQTSTAEDGTHYFCNTYDEHVAYSAQKK